MQFIRDIGPSGNHVGRKVPSLESRALLPLGILGASSLAGGLTAAVTVAGRAMPTTATLLWIVTLLGVSLLLASWALLFGRWLRLRVGIAPIRSLQLSTLCHSPLLAGLVLVHAVYADDAFNYLYSASAHGRMLYRPLAILALLAVPSTLQLITLALARPRKAVRYLSVLAPIGVALLLRLWSINWQLPFTLHGDEFNYFSSAMLLGQAREDLNPHSFTNPSIMFYLDMAIFHLFGGARAEDFRVLVEALGQRITDPRGWYLVVLASRALVALFGTATVALVFLAAKELFDRGVGLTAAWFLAVSFLHVRDSHYATNDVSASCLAMASFLFAARLNRTGRWRDYLAAGFLGGLATSTKYNAGIFAFPILVAHLTRQPSRKQPSLFSPTLMAPLAAAYVASALAFVLGTPYSVLDWPTFSAGFARQLGFGSAPWFGQALTPTWLMYLTTLVQGFGLLPLLLALLGAASLTRRDRRPLALTLAFPLVYYLFMSHEGLFFARFAVPLLPFLAILAGKGAVWASHHLKPLRFGRPIFAALLLLALAQPAAYSVLSNVIIGREDTRVLADRWVSANIPDQGELMVDYHSELLFKYGWPSRKDLVVRWYTHVANPEAWREENRRPIFVAITSFGYDGVRRGIGDTTVLPEEYRSLEQEGELVAIFAAGYGGTQLPYAQDDVYTPFWTILQRERPGPTVRIYRMD
jgi:hypothetical protein